jgi:tRNA nucleotidyltransferase (CCA-adding enzyme)
MGIEPKDIDIEVYKISYEALMTTLSHYGRVDLVGKKFGVIAFHPFGSEMKYDFSVPRKENKFGTGHKGFEITFDLDMTIKDAAERRDFTFNALAYDPITDQLYDYYGGVEDLKNKIIRHTSDKFSEDYLRILRAMQFQARFDFEIHPDTIDVMKVMLQNSDEFFELSVERVYVEWKKWAEKGIRHDLIFKFMRDTGLIECYPELKALKETPQDAIYHPEGDVEIHTELCLAHLDKLIDETINRPRRTPSVAEFTPAIVGNEKIVLVMATLLHDIAKPATTKEEMKNGRMTITSNGHEAMGGVMARKFLSEKLGFSDELIFPICNIVANHLAGVNIKAIESPAGQVKAVKKLSRRLYPATIKQLLCVMEADTNGRGKSGYQVVTGGSEIYQIAEHSLDIIDKRYEYVLMGRHLIEAGLTPSPDFKKILQKSYEAQENGEFSDVEGAKKWLNEFLKNNYGRTKEHTKGTC